MELITNLLKIKKMEHKIKIQVQSIGKVKYAVSYSDGTQKHKDGSEFFGIACFNNKKKLAKWMKENENRPYVK